MMINTTTATIDEILNECKRALVTKRSSFYPNKDFGSKLHMSGIRLDEILSYARQALSSFDGIYVKSVTTEGDEAIFEITVNNKKEEVRIKI